MRIMSQFAAPGESAIWKDSCELTSVIAAEERSGFIPKSASRKVEAASKLLTFSKFKGKKLQNTLLEAASIGSECIKKGAMAVLKCLLRRKLSSSINTLKVGTVWILLLTVVMLTARFTLASPLSSLNEPRIILNCLTDFGKELTRDWLLERGHAKGGEIWDCCDKVNELLDPNPCLQNPASQSVADVITMLKDRITNKDPLRKKFLVDSIYTCARDFSMPGVKPVNIGDIATCFAFFQTDFEHFHFAKLISGGCHYPGYTKIANWVGLGKWICETLPNQKNKSVMAERYIDNKLASYERGCPTKEQLKSLTDSYPVCQPSDLAEAKFLKPQMNELMSVWLNSQKYVSRLELMMAYINVDSFYSWSMNVNPEYLDKAMEMLCPQPHNKSSCMIKGLDHYTKAYINLIQAHKHHLINDTCLEKTMCVPRISVINDEDCWKCAPWSDDYDLSKYQQASKEILDQIKEDLKGGPEVLYPMMMVEDLKFNDGDLLLFSRAETLKRRDSCETLFVKVAAHESAGVNYDRGISKLLGCKFFDPILGNQHLGDKCKQTKTNKTGCPLDPASLCPICDSPNEQTTAEIKPKVALPNHEEQDLVQLTSSVASSKTGILLTMMALVKSVWASPVNLRPMTHFSSKTPSSEPYNKDGMKDRVAEILANKMTFTWVDMECSNFSNGCLNVKKSSFQCIQVIQSKETVTAISSDEDLCEGSSCADVPLRAIQPADFTIGHPPDSTIFVPDEIGPDRIGFSTPGKCKSYMNGYNVPIKLSGSCLLDVTDTRDGMIFIVTSSKHSHLIYSIEGQPEVEKWLLPNEKLELRPTSGDDFSSHLKLWCNGFYVDEKFILNRREWCDRHSLWVGSSYVCKHGELLWWCLLFLGIGLILHLAGDIITDALSVIFTLGSFGTSTLLSMIFTKNCVNCGYKLARWPISRLYNHLCESRCAFCDQLLADLSSVNQHFKTCSCNTWLNRMGLSLTAAKALVSNYKTVLGWLTRRSKVLIALLIIFTLMDTAYAAPVNTVGKPNVTLWEDFKLDLAKLGAHEELVPANLGNLASLAVVMTQKSETCDSSSCVAKGKLTATLKAQAGNSFHAVISSPEGEKINEDLYIIIEQSGLDYPYDNLYKACESESVAGTDWQCTGSCDTAKVNALDNLKKLLGKPPPTYTSFVDHDASTWGWEPCGCIVASGGCAASACVERAKPENCVDVIQTRKGTFWLKICFYFLGKYDCLKITETETKATKGLSLVLSSQEQAENPTKFVLTKTAKVLTGEINGAGEFGPKFGYPQFDQNDPNIGNCGYGAHGSMYVDSGTCGSAHVSYCCSSTYSLLNHLKPRLDLIAGANKLTKFETNAGTVTLELEVSGLITKDIKQGNVISFKLESSKGCYNCNTGFTVTASAQVNLRGRYSIECDPNPISIDTVYLQSGNNQIVFKSTSATQSMTMKCRLAGVESSATFNLDRKEFEYDKPTERGVISLGSTHGNFIAWLEDIFDPMSWGIGGAVRKLIFLIVVALTIALVYYGATLGIPLVKKLWDHSKQSEPNRIYKPMVLSKSKKKKGT
uniref:Putative glycoprotein n=1 Tax=Wuhan snail virus 2 TaxID=1923749 RepID=A0A1L3KPQ0_9VIRU|nr:putative glycoprotein [Wuhan snail virus 2]